MSLDHLREFLVGFKPLPLQRSFPVVEETPRPGLSPVAPQLSEGFLQQVGGVEPLVGCQQRLECLTSLQSEVVAVRQQRVLVSFDEAAILALQPRILTLAHLIERLTQVAQHVELVEQDARLRGSAGGGVSKRLPHVHHRQTNAPGFLFSQPAVELMHAGLRAVLATKPDRAPTDQVADHDAIGVALANRDLVDANDFGAGCTGALELHAHVLLVQLFDRVPVQVEFLGHILDTRLAATAPHKVGKALGVEGVVGQKLEALALHFAAAPTAYAAHLELQIHSRIPARQIANAPSLAIVPTRVHATTAAAQSFFERRIRVSTRAFGSPNTPRTLDWGRKPGNAYVSHSRRCRLPEVAMESSCQKLPTSSHA